MSEQKQANKKQLIIIASVLIVLIAAAALIYTLTKPDTQQGAKTIYIQVVVSDTDVREYTLHTDAEFLADALNEKELVEGSDGAYGLFITAVDGVAADDSKQQWWCLTKGGADVMTGADTTPIADGDKFELTLKTGW